MNSQGFDMPLQTHLYRGGTVFSLFFFHITNFTRTSTTICTHSKIEKRGRVIKYSG